MNPLYVGVDIASKENWACCMNSQGDELASFAFANNLVGATTLKDRCLVLATRHDIDSLLVGMEATANFWWHLSVYLSTERELSHLNPKVYNINPKIVKGFKKSYPFLPKTDRIDAWVIADRLKIRQAPCTVLPGREIPATATLNAISVSPHPANRRGEELLPLISLAKI